MKCPNCGFDCEGNFCTMCGTSLKSQSPQTENKQNPYINIENKQPLNNSHRQYKTKIIQIMPTLHSRIIIKMFRLNRSKVIFRVHSLNSRRIFLIFHSKDQTVL